MYTYTFEKREKKEDRYRAREQLIVGNSGQIFSISADIFQFIRYSLVQTSGCSRTLDNPR